MIKALHNRCELESFDRFVERKKSAAILILPIENSLQVLSVIKENISPTNFLHTLEQTQKMLVNESNVLMSQESLNTENQRSKFGLVVIFMLFSRCCTVLQV